MALLARIVRADRAAFVCLHAQLRPGVAAQLVTVPLVPADVTAVVNATFVEVWRRAEHCPASEPDVRAWVAAIAARRAGDRWIARSVPPFNNGRHTDVLVLFDRQVGAALEALLARHRNTGHER